MKKVVIIISSLFLWQAGFAQNAAQGEKVFKASCAACHSIGKGKLVGPDLSGVNSRRNEKWLVSWIKSSQAMLKKNDPIGVKLFNEFNKMPMPDQNLSDGQIKDVLAYIKIGSPAAKPQGAPAVQSSKKGAGTTGDKGTPGKKKADPWVDAEYQVKSYKASADINPRNLNDDAWKNIAGRTLPLSRQNVVYPNLQKATIDSITVKSIYRPNQIAFLVEWNDPSNNTDVDVDQFCDQFAVQLPMNTDNIPSFMMGAGGKVHIVHWKSVWQVDCEKGFQDVQVKYPNMWADVYPGLEGHLDRSKKTYARDIPSELIVETHVTGNMPGTYSGNPMSQIKRKEPVEEALAEGYGTLATQESQLAKGWGQWENGKWKVCVIVPVNTGDDHKAIVKDKTKIAFAIWDGGNQNIGGRKHYIPWVDLLLEK